MKLYELFCSCDCTQLEINPLAETSEGDVMCVDAKLNFDDNAEFRQHDIFSFRDYSQEDPREGVRRCRRDVVVVHIEQIGRAHV